ncbi:MAG: YHS domain-containing protein [Rhodanobacteraceae bacterium]|nr:YHS domain-containing protein [Rhodanobacteraceae bacterium]
MSRISLHLKLSAVLALALAGAAAVPTSVFAYDAESTSAINTEAGAVILHGYDPVAYFAAGKPTKGDAKFSASHGGATYHFASEANRKTFQSNPEHYVPQFGGFCAMGAALGKKLDVDPMAFKVVDGKLYLNVNADVFKKWSENIPANIAKAEANWPLIKDKTPASL